MQQTVVEMNRSAKSSSCRRRVSRFQELICTRKHVAKRNQERAGQGVGRKDDLEPSRGPPRLSQRPSVLSTSASG